MSNEVPEEWAETSLGHLVSLEYGKSLPASTRSIGPVPVYGSSGITGYHNQALIDRPGIIIGRKGTIGTVHVSDRPFWPIDTVYYVEPIATVNPLWLVNLLKQLQLSKLNEATGVPGLNRDKAYQQRVRVPPLAEQKKIAAILTSVDDAIAATEALIAQTRRVKQGMLKQLLTRGIGHTRFKHTEIGEIPEGWEIGILGSIATFQPGYPFKSTEFVVSGDRLLRGSNVGVGRTNWEPSATKHFSPERRAEFKDYELSVGDIVIAMDRPFVGGGFKAARIESSDLPALLLQRVGRFLPSTKCNSDWLWQVVSSGTLRTHLEQRQVGTDLPHISKSDIEECLLAIPPVEEQRHIVSIFKDLDLSLALEQAELTKLHALKSALMSNLLTGRKRVSLP